MEVISITSGREPSVTRQFGSTHVYLTIDGLREAKVRDRDTRLRIALGTVQATKLWQLLSDVLTEEERGAETPRL